MQHRFRLNTIASLFVAGSATLAPHVFAAEAADLANGQLMDTVVVSGSRIAHPSQEVPASIDVVDSARIQDGQIRVNASEALAAVPGLVVQNRQNYAQDLQISSRGFGARSAFGVRGVKLISDGIPASMPDGQGQAATFNLDTAERIEVLRGPFSAIYGNHSGGVIQLFSKDGQNPPSVELNVTGGSFGTSKVDLTAQGQAGGIGYVLDGSRFRTDGFRDHSAATREQAFGKITVKPNADSKLTIVANSLHQGNTQDPLGATWATFAANPRAGEIDPKDDQIPKRSFAERYNTRKSIDHQQIGATYEQAFGDDRLHVMVYGGNRDVIQYQAFNIDFQKPPSHSGGVVDFQRQFYGIDTNWLHVNQLAGGKLSTTIGIDYGRSSDDRTGYENFIGNSFGVKGKLRRDEQNVVSSLDPYIQAEWQSGPWLLSAGVRYSKMKVSVDDHYLSNGNDSGSLEFSHTTPVLGLLYKLTPNVNVYASAARGFEAPTLNELFYSGKDSGFNFNLKPATSTNLEAGVKARINNNTQVNAAVFQIKTNDELVVDKSSGGRTSYINASKTLRQGMEVSLDSNLPYGFTTKVALSSLHAVYDQAFKTTSGTTVREGSRLPGIPSANLFAELAWKDTLDRFGAALESVASNQVYAEDSNIEKPAPGYTVFNARFNAKQNVGNWHFKEFARLNNLFDKTYVGSVIVGDSNKRYYEAAPGRNWLLGMSAQYSF